MIRFLVQSGLTQLEISLPVEGGNEAVAPAYDGDEAIAVAVRAQIDNSYGAFGHLLDSSNISAIDLDYALKSLQGYQVSILEGADLVAEYDPQVPEDAVT